MGVAAVVLFAVAAYAQRQIRYFTQGWTRIAAVRTILIVTGVGFGFVSAANVQEPLLKTLTFVVGFGMVHVPAAIILLIKRKRGAGKS